jgi:nucleoside-diphosphate-sugar epimerase
VSKVRGEADVSRFADERFSPTFLRSATAYGVSPRLRVDVVVNNLAGVAWTTGEVLIQSDGTPWRPLVHVEDISRAFVAVLEAPRELVHNQAFNVGSTDENYQVREIAEIVQNLVPGSTITYLAGGGPDARCYRVNCDKLASTLPDARPEWTVRRGVAELCASFERYGLTVEDCSRFTRLRHIQELFRDDRLDSALRWKQARMAV